MLFIKSRSFSMILGDAFLNGARMNDELRKSGLVERLNSWEFDQCSRVMQCVLDWSTGYGPSSLS